MDTVVEVNEVCEKCRALKTWNGWYRPDELKHTCDDCRPSGLYGDLTPEQAQRIERQIDDRAYEKYMQYKKDEDKLINATMLIAHSTKVWVVGSQKVETLGKLLLTHADTRVSMITGAREGQIAIWLEEEK